ncbi:MAG: FtsX-like permease family protein [Bdellovibrionaceae bacterium]|nr:FtsX-like permease family protein [Pseudobdellovibrionaceae bacterium]
MKLFRWALRELRRSWRMSLFFVLNLSLGLTGFIALEAYKTALENHLRSNRQQILGADLALSARRELTDEELSALRDVTGDAPGSVVYDFFAMVASPQGSRLVLVKAIDDRYPLYGELTLSDGKKLVPEPDGIWVYPELLEQLGVKTGDRLKLGDLQLTLREVITQDSTQTFRSAGIAPRVFIDRAALPKSGLLQFGSTFTKSHLFRAPREEDADLWQKRLFERIKDSAVQVETSRESGEDSNRQLNFLSDFLGLVALVALFLAALGAAYIWRLFLQQRTKDVAILRSLGLGGTDAVLLYVIEALILGTVALLPAILAAQILFPILNQALSTLTPFALTPLLTGSSVLMGLGLSLGVSLLVALPFLLRLRDIHPAQLFSEEKFNPELDLKRPWAFLPALVLLWALAVLQAKSFFVGSLFTGALLGVLFILSAGGWVLLRVLADIRSGPWEIRQGLRSAGRRRIASLAVFIALGLGSLLMNILPQVKASLQDELRIEGPSKVPSLFLFDIQDEQVGPVQDFLKERQVDLAHLSPLIRSRILKVNGQDFERQLNDSAFRTREEDREARMRNRGVNLSFRPALADSETVTEGRPMEGAWNAESGRRPQLSVEERYAGRMGLKIGDVLLFDVQGVELEGEIVNLRKVRWTSFQPNFFVLIQEGVLDDAPKTWIAGVPRLSTEQKNGLQSELTRRFTNVSVVDVARTVNDLMKVADQMSWSLELMAALSVLTGAVVLYSIARSQVRHRRWELNLIKILGASPAKVRLYLLSEFAVLAFLSSLLGSCLSVIVSSTLLWQMFDGGFTVDPAWILGTTLFVTVLGVVVSERAAAKVVRERPLNLLRGE